MNKARGGILLLLGFVGCGFAGCGPAPLMADSRPVEMSGWLSSDVAVFHWDVSDTTLKQHVMLDVRHGQDYEFSNIYLFLTYRYPNGKSRVDTLECVLADAYGKWRGSGFGDLVDQRFLVHEAVTFPVRGRYTLEVAHGMRMDPLEGMADIGLRLEASQ
ncbi:MAG: gliding motility lipoprotein GldH [Bacteroidetes bacterium]|nr:gliding motility lipoprotein GldH [Bacteroidota bacterium]MDA0903569.1 gliding motility lipoprotein GldH [Bacteroidota bacterium]MDA1242124.1 gliding motility lipoprotein GldH [Bacteroidota bacterium]